MIAAAEREKAYRAFRKICDDAVAKIDAIRDGREPTEGDSEAMRSVANLALAEMADSTYGRTFMRDVNLQQVLNELENGLSWCSGELDPESGGFIWADVDNESERALRFWGRMAEIFYYFRDRGLSLNTKEEADMRRSMIGRGKELIADIDGILGHISVQLTYDRSVIRKMKTVRGVLNELNGEIKGRQPRGEDSDDVNPFQAGNTIVVRQFVKSVCELCFELFGCIRSSHLDVLLVRKSSTADQLGLTPWLSIEGGGPKRRDSTLHSLDLYIKGALNVALKKAAARGWSTEGALKVFDESNGWAKTPSGDVASDGHVALTRAWFG